MSNHTVNISNEKGISESNDNLVRKTITFGYPSTGTDVPEEYKIKIVSNDDRNNYDIEIIALLQKEVTLKTGGRWDPFRASALGTGAEILAQWIFDTSLIMPVLSRRMWRGSSPLELTLDLKFEAVYDAKNEVLLPCALLHRMSLPGYKLGGGVIEDMQKEQALAGKAPLSGNLLSVLSPPGPSPFPGKMGDIISIHIGKMLTFKGVILTDVTSSIPSKYSEGGLPVSTNMSIRFESYQIMAKEDFLMAFNTKKVEETQKKIIPPKKADPKENYANWDDNMEKNLRGWL